MDMDKTAYRVRIDFKEGSAAVFCISYPLDTAKQHYGIEFYELFWNHRLPASPIPSVRQATFQESLLTLHQAATTRENTMSDENVIVAKLRSVYGKDALIQLSIINQNLPQSDLLTD